MRLHPDLGCFLAIFSDCSPAFLISLSVGWPPFTQSWPQWVCHTHALLSPDCLLLQALMNSAELLCWRVLAFPDSAVSPHIWESGVLSCQEKADLRLSLFLDFSHIMTWMLSHSSLRLPKSEHLGTFWCGRVWDQREKKVVSERTIHALYGWFPSHCSPLQSFAKWKIPEQKALTGPLRFY